MRSSELHDNYAYCQFAVHDSQITMSIVSSQITAHCSQFTNFTFHVTFWSKLSSNSIGSKRTFRQHSIKKIFTSCDLCQIFFV